jgi:hypothetical protein
MVMPACGHNRQASQACARPPFDLRVPSVGRDEHKHRAAPISLPNHLPNHFVRQFSFCENPDPPAFYRSLGFFEFDGLPDALQVADLDAAGQVA